MPSTFFFSFRYSGSEIKFPISPAAPDTSPSPTTQGASFHPPRPWGTVRSRDSPRDSGFGLPPTPRPSASSQPTALPAPPQPGQAPSPPSSRGQVAHPSPPPRQASSRSEFFPAFPHTAPRQERPSAPRLRRGAPGASRSRRSRRARAPLTPQPGRRGSCCGGSSGCASPPPSRPPPSPPLSLRPDPGRPRPGSASPGPPLWPPEPSVLH